MASNVSTLNIYETHLCSDLLDQQDSYKIVFSKVSKLVFWISNQLVLVWTLQWSTCHLRFFTGLLDHMLYLRLRKKILGEQQWDLLVHCAHCGVGFQIKIGRPKFYTGEMITLA